MGLYNSWKKEVEVFRTYHPKDVRDMIRVYIRMWGLFDLRYLERVLDHPERKDLY